MRLEPFFVSLNRYAVPLLDPTDPIDRIVVAIWSDVTDRGGWDGLWDSFDDDVKAEIIASWRVRIRDARGTS